MLYVLAFMKKAAPDKLMNLNRDYGNRKRDKCRNEDIT